jgi:hypothetical protein
MTPVSILAALCLLAGAACSTAPPPIAPEPATSAPPRDAPPPARGPAFSPGPLRVEPAFSGTVSGWAGVSMFQNLISSGFSRDSRLFANCHVANATVFTKACDLIDRDQHVARSVVSNVDYGDGHSAAHDPVLQKVLGPLGVPAPQGTWRYAADLVVAWRQPNPKEIDVALLENSTQTETPIASFKRSDRMLLVPDRVVLAPNGRRLAIVVYIVGGPPLTTDADLVDADRAASAAYARAADAAQAKGDVRAAEVLRAKSRAALRRS